MDGGLWPETCDDAVFVWIKSVFANTKNPIAKAVRIAKNKSMMCCLSKNNNGRKNKIRLVFRKINFLILSPSEKTVFHFISIRIFEHFGRERTRKRGYFTTGSAIPILKKFTYSLIDEPVSFISALKLDKSLFLLS